MFQAVFFVSVEHPFLGPSPDALIQCVCCGEGVVEIMYPLRASEKVHREVADGARNFCLDELPGGRLWLHRDHVLFSVPNANLCDKAIIF